MTESTYPLSLTRDEATALYDHTSGGDATGRAFKAKMVRLQDDLASAATGTTRLPVDLDRRELELVTRLQIHHEDLLRGVAIAATRWLMTIEQGEARTVCAAATDLPRDYTIDPTAMMPARRRYGRGQADVVRPARPVYAEAHTKLLALRVRSAGRLSYVGEIPLGEALACASRLR